MTFNDQHKTKQKIELNLDPQKIEKKNSKCKYLTKVFSQKKIPVLNPFMMMIYYLISFPSHTLLFFRFNVKLFVCCWLVVVVAYCFQRPSHFRYLFILNSAKKRIKFQRFLFTGSVLQYIFLSHYMHNMLMLYILVVYIINHSSFNARIYCLCISFLTFIFFILPFVEWMKIYKAFVWTGNIFFFILK